MTPITIDKVRVIDLRFPTSREHIGSDVVNKDSAANCILETNSGPVPNHFSVTASAMALSGTITQSLEAVYEGRHLSSAKRRIDGLKDEGANLLHAESWFEQSGN